jgi:hypothetical protein
MVLLVLAGVTTTVEAPVGGLANTNSAAKPEVLLAEF